MYRSGFATTQEAYQQAVTKLFEGLDSIEKILDGKDYLVGDRLTEADIRLYTTIVSIISPAVCDSNEWKFTIIISSSCRSDLTLFTTAISSVTLAPSGYGSPLLSFVAETVLNRTG